jgi:hypothetical protein
MLEKLALLKMVFGRASAWWAPALVEPDAGVMAFSSSHSLE